MVIRQRWLGVILTLQVAFVIPSLGQAGGHDQALQQLLSEAARPWEEYARYSTRLQGSVTRTVSIEYLDKRTSKQVPAGKTVVRQNDRCALLTIPRRSTTPETLSLHALANTRYCALIQRDSARPE